LIDIDNQQKILIATTSSLDAYEEVLDKGNNGAGDDEHPATAKYRKNCTRMPCI
jgi:hypothetical protein